MSGLPRVQTSTPGIAWPGLPGAAGAQMLALQWQLDQTQWWPSGLLLEYQFRQLRRLVEHSVAHVPFYRDAARSGRLTDPSQLGPDAFRRWPILRKNELRANEVALRSTYVPASHGRVSELQTTGSTGSPVRVLRTDMDALLSDALVIRDHLAHGRNLNGKFATIRTGVAKRKQGTWGIENAAFKTGPACAIPLATPLEDQLDWLLSERPAYLLATPLNVRELVLLSRRRGAVPQGLRAVLTFAAMLPSGLRELVQAAWKTEVVDTYSCVEASTLACQCPGYEHYLVQAENVYLEVLRDDGTPCSPGEMGRVVITPLHNFAMPLLRYDLGDYAEVGPSCPTGRGLPTLTRIAGRVRNLFRYPDGAARSPNVPPDVWFDTPIIQYRVIQHTLSRIEVEHVAARQLSTYERDRLSRRIRECLGHAFDITFTELPEIGRQKAGKYEEFVSHVLAPEDAA